MDKGDIDEITEVLRLRLEVHGEMYTAIGDNVLVALNPYTALAKGGCPLYADSVALHYWRRSPHLTAPHVFKQV
jgi:myosin heavy subunit